MLPADSASVEPRRRGHLQQLPRFLHSGRGEARRASFESGSAEPPRGRSRRATVRWPSAGSVSPSPAASVGGAESRDPLRSERGLGGEGRADTQ